MFKTIKSKFKRYYPFFKAKIMDFLVYKWAIYGWVLSDVFILFLTYFLWLAIYKSSGNDVINGFDFNTMMTYVVLAQITMQVAFSSDSFWTLSQEIRSGSIVMHLIRPINYRISLIFGTIGNYTISLFIIIVPALVIAYSLLYFGLGVSLPSVINVLFYLLSTVMALLIIDSLNFLIGLIAFYTQSLFGISIIKDSVLRFLSGSIIPLAFFPLWARNILAFLPFSSLVETPIMILLGKMDTSTILTSLALQFMWVVIFYILANLGYKRAVKHVVSQGG
jgi:ABC-2 type transport system permease protein